MHEINKFIEFETKHKLFDIKVNDINIWPFIREKIYNQISSDINNIGTAHNVVYNLTRREKLIALYKFIPNVLFNNIFPLKRKDVLVINHSRRVKNDEFFDCLYTDSFLDKMDYSYYVFEDTFLQQHLKPVKTKNLKYTDRINCKFYFEFYFKKKFLNIKLSDDNLLILGKLVTNLNIAFDNVISLDEFIKIIKDEILKYKILYKYYEKIIDKIDPKIIMEVISYERKRKIINCIAKDKNIPTIELQHGTMGKYEIAYNYAEKMKICTFPDFIFLFGQFWKDVTRLPNEDSNIKIVGWPYYEQKKEESINKIYNKEKKVILFISQGTIGKELSKIAIELSRGIDLKSYRIIYKLHPGEYNRWRNEYPWLEDDKIMVIDNNQYDMHYYYRLADFQVGVYSTALFEGLGYGLKTFIIKLFGYEYMEELYTYNYVDLIANSSELREGIILESKHKYKYDINFLWKNNSISNILYEINQIINKRIV